MTFLQKYRILRSIEIPQKNLRTRRSGSQNEAARLPRHAVDPMSVPTKHSNLFFGMQVNNSNQLPGSIRRCKKTTFFSTTTYRQCSTEPFGCLRPVQLFEITQCYTILTIDSIEIPFP